MNLILGCYIVDYINDTELQNTHNNGIHNITYTYIYTYWQHLLITGRKDNNEIKHSIWFREFCQLHERHTHMLVAT